RVHPGRGAPPPATPARASTRLAGVPDPSEAVVGIVAFSNGRAVTVRGLGGSCGARATTDRSDARLPAPRGAGDAAAGGPRPHSPGSHGCDDRRRRRSRGAARVLGWLPPRRRVHASTAVGAGQDG